MSDAAATQAVVSKLGRPGLLPRLFGRFEQVVQRREQGGFGIGLWLVYQLTRAMGGSVTVTSRVGDGSTFAVRLPRHMAAEGDGDA